MIAKEYLKLNGNELMEFDEKGISRYLLQDIAIFINNEVKEIKIIQGLSPYLLINNEVKLDKNSRIVENFDEGSLMEYFQLLGLPVPIRLQVRDLL